MIKRFGKLITASFIIMGVGVVAFLLTPFLIWIFDIDTDILGAFIILIGLVIYIIGLIRRKKLGRVKLALLVTLVSVLSIPILVLVASLIYYLITGKEIETLIQ